MRTFPLTHALLVTLVLGVGGCSGQPDTGKVSPPATDAKTTPKVTRIEAGPDAPKQAQTALIKAKQGDVIEFGAGKFEFQSTLSLDVSGVTIRGQGPDKTILSFKEPGQGTGGEGLLITSKHGRHSREPRRGRHPGDAIKVQRHQGARLPQRPHRVDRRAQGNQRRLRNLPRAVQRRGDRGLHGPRRLRRRHLRRPVAGHRRPAQHGREERRGHRDRELDPGRCLRE